MKLGFLNGEVRNEIAVVGALVVNSIYMISGSLGLGDVVNSKLAGSEKAASAGDSNGRGDAQLRLSKEDSKICYTLSVQEIDLPATETYIKSGQNGSIGEVVFALTPPDINGNSKGCVKGDNELINDLRKNKGNYYISVHNIEYPEGAIRGQLE